MYKDKPEQLEQELLREWYKMVTVFSREQYNELKPKMDKNLICLQCYREFKRPIKTRFNNEPICKSCLSLVERAMSDHGLF